MTTVQIIGYIVALACVAGPVLYAILTEPKDRRKHLQFTVMVHRRDLTLMVDDVAEKFNEDLNALRR